MRVLTDADLAIDRDSTPHDTAKHMCSAAASKFRTDFIKYADYFDMEVTSSNTVGVMVVPPSSAAQTWHTDDNPVLNTKGKKIFFAVFAGPCEEFRMGYIPREDDDNFPTHSVDARKKWMRYAPCSIGCHSTQAAHCGLQAPARALKTYRVYIEGLHRKLRRGC